MPRREKRPKPLKKTLTGSLQTIVIETELSRARKIDEIVNQGKIGYEALAIPKPGKRKKKSKQAKIKNYKEVCKEVDKRDNHTCQHPGCRCKIVQHHHARFKSQGGQDRIEELVDLCYAHHQGDESPHQSEYWRIYWVNWLKRKYPRYWADVEDSNKIRVGV